ncbi:MAG: M28 family peptidase [Spirochaetes bacterium]|nr:MAG: M28 family peptidase [Spirochaetota bacterium]
MKKKIAMMVAALALGASFLFPFKGNGAGPEVSTDLLKAHVAALTRISPPRNSVNIASLDKAAEYIKAAFLKTGAESYFQHYSNEHGDFKNVVLRINPNMTDVVVVGAHYDVFGDFPGADDNASGVAGLLELARLLTATWTSKEVSLELVAYGSEEPPFFGTREMGSAGHARYMAKQFRRVRAMIALEMIGFFSDARRSQRYPQRGMEQAYPDTGNFIAIVGRTEETSLLARVKKAMTGVSALPVQSIAAPASVTGVNFSDHRNYWEVGFPAIMVTDTAFYRNPSYHTAGDTIDTLDFARMAEVVKGVHAAVMDLARE